MFVLQIDKGAIEDAALNPNLTDVRLLKTCLVETPEVITASPSDMTTALMSPTTPKPCEYLSHVAISGRGYLHSDTLIHCYIALNCLFNLNKVNCDSRITREEDRTTNN